MMNRRGFIRTMAAGAAGTAFLGYEAAGHAQVRPVAPSDRVNLAIIGAGSRGRWMLQRMLRAPGVRVVAACDVYEPRFDAVRQLTGEATPAYRDYRKMLDEVKDLDAVLVATPLSFHRDHVVAALERGCHVFGEKSMAYTAEDCDEIVAAVRRSGKRFQIGHQYRYAPWYRQAVERIHAGEIGRVTHVFGYWHRNNNWRRDVPDPSLEKLINWRLYREFSGGLLAELGSHHIDVANWIFGEHPVSVIGNGGIDIYPDGRETYDNVQAVFNYPSGGKLIFSSLLGNQRIGFLIVVSGTGGSVELTLEGGRFFYEQALPNSAVPEDLAERGIGTSATLATRGDVPYSGPGEPIVVPEEHVGEPDTLAALAFIESVRKDQKPFADERIGWGSGAAVAYGNTAIYEGRRVEIGPLPAG